MPNQVSHDFDVNMVLDHAHAKKKLIIPITFVATATVNPRRTDAQADEYYNYAQQDPYASGGD